MHTLCILILSRTVQDTAIQHIRQQSIKPELDELPTLDETTKAIKQLKSGKAAGLASVVNNKTTTKQTNNDTSTKTKKHTHQNDPIKPSTSSNLKK